MKHYLADPLAKKISAVGTSFVQKPGSGLFTKYVITGYNLFFYY